MLAKLAKTILRSKQLVIFIFYRGIERGYNQEQRAKMKEQSFLVASFRGSRATVGISYPKRQSEGAERPWESHTETTQEIATSLTALAMTA